MEIPADGARPKCTASGGMMGTVAPVALFPSEAYADNGVIFVGRDDVMLSNYNGGAKFRSGRKVADFKQIPETLPKCSNWDRCPYEEWINACKGWTEGALRISKSLDP